MYDWRADVRATLVGAGLAVEHETQVVEEIAQHLEEQFAELSERMDPERARAMLLAQLRDTSLTGVATSGRRTTRSRRVGLRLERMGGVWRDIAHATRSLVRSPGVAIPAVVALALGIGLTTAMFSVIYGILIKGLPFRDGDRIAMVLHGDPSRGEDATNVATFMAYAARQQAFEAFGAYHFGEVNIAGGDRPDRLRALYATSGVLDVPSVRPMLGRALVAGDGAPDASPVAVLSYTAWRDRFAGDSSVVGKPLRVDGRPHTIVGVMPESFEFPNAVHVWLPLTIDRTSPANDETGVMVVGRLRQGVSYERATAELAALARSFHVERREDPRKHVVTVVPFVRGSIQARIYTLLYAMLGAVGLVLIVACANVANLLLHRAADRLKEIGILAALGASRAAIVRRALVESALLAGAAAIAGTALAQWFIFWFDHSLPMTEAPFWTDLRLHVPVLVFTICVAFAAGVLAGVLPAVQSARVDVSAILKSDILGVAALRIGRVSRTVIVAEIAVASAMLLAAGFMTKSIIRMTNIEPGFRTSGITTARVAFTPADASRRRELLRELEAGVAALPGIEAAFVGDGLPGTGWGVAPIAVEGRSYARERDRPYSRHLSVSAGFFRTFGVTVARGRGFSTSDDASTTPVAVVSESFARREFRNVNPIGQRIRVGNDSSVRAWRTIVGVIPTLVAASLQNPRPPEVLTPLAQDRVPGSPTIALLGGGDVASTLRKLVTALDPDAAVTDISSMDAALAEWAWPMRVFGTAFVAFGVAAIVLAAIGLYAVMAFSVSRRTRELGIRLALGATGAALVRMICRQASVTIGIGISLGLGLGALLARAMQAALFDVSPTDVSVFATIGTVLGLVSLVACLVPAVKATRLDPAVTLRSE
jgi:putative ABC transport system permease protein